MFNFPKTARIASHNFAFEITLSQAITLTLLLVCSFSPKVRKYLLGSPDCFVFDQSIVASDNRPSYTCILLLPTGTQYPAGSPNSKKLEF